MSGFFNDNCLCHGQECIGRAELLSSWLFQPQLILVITVSSPARRPVPFLQLWMHLFLYYIPGALQDSSKCRLDFTCRFTFLSRVWETRHERMIKSVLSKMTSSRRRGKHSAVQVFAMSYNYRALSVQVFTLLFLLLLPGPRCPPGRCSADSSARAGAPLGLPQGAAPPPPLPVASARKGGAQHPGLGCWCQPMSLGEKPSSSEQGTVARGIRKTPNALLCWLLPWL